MTFKVCNSSSKLPYFNRAFVVRVPIFFSMTVCMKKIIGRQRYLNSRPKDQKVDDKTTPLRGFMKIRGTFF